MHGCAPHPHFSANASISPSSEPSPPGPGWGVTCTGCVAETGWRDRARGVTRVPTTVKKMLSCCKVTKGLSQTLQRDGWIPVCSRAQEACCVSEQQPEASPPHTSWSLSSPPPRYEQPKCDNTARAHPARTRDLYKSRQLQGEWAWGWAGLSGCRSVLSCRSGGEGARESLVVKNDLKLREAVSLTL